MKMEQKKYTCKRESNTGNSPVLQLENEKFINKYGNLNDYRIPAIISIFSQDNNKINNIEFKESLCKEIDCLQKKLKHTPLFFLIQCNNNSERTIAEYLIENDKNVIIIGNTPDCPIDNYDRYIFDEEPEKVMLDSSWAMFAFWDGKKDSINDDGKRVENAVVKMLKGGVDEVIKNDDYQMKFPNTAKIVHFIIERSDLEIEDFETRYLYTHYTENGINWYYITEDTYKHDIKKFKEGDTQSKNKRAFFKENSTKLDKLNKHILKFKIKSKKEVDDLLPDMFTDNNRLNDTRCRFVMYDQFAQKKQTTRSKQSLLLIILAALGLITYSVFDDIYQFWLFLLAYIAIFGFVYILYKIINKVNAHEDYIFSRVFAEGLRAQAYWYAVGIDKSVREFYPVSHRYKLGWVYLSVNALHTLNRSIGGNIGTTDECEPGWLDDIKAFWIGCEEYSKYKEDNKIKTKNTIYEVGQYSYHHKGYFNKQKKNKKSNILVTMVTTISVILTVALPIFMFFTKLNQNNFSQSTADIIETVSMFILSILPIIIAAFTTNSTVKCYREEYQRHKWCEILTKRAVTDMENTDLSCTIKTVFKEYGRQSMDENGDWAIMKLERHPEILKK